jgi:hypothetical protein
MGIKDAIREELKKNIEWIPDEWPDDMAEKAPFFHICQKLRDIYNRTNDEEIKRLCRLATSDAKKLQRTMRVYRAFVIHIGEDPLKLRKQYLEEEDV